MKTLVFLEIFFENLEYNKSVSAQIVREFERAPHTPTNMPVY